MFVPGSLKLSKIFLPGSLWHFIFPRRSSLSRQQNHLHRFARLAQIHCLLLIQRFQIYKPWFPHPADRILFFGSLMLFISGITVHLSHGKSLLLVHLNVSKSPLWVRSWILNSMYLTHLQLYKISWYCSLPASRIYASCSLEHFRILHGGSLRHVKMFLDGSFI